MLLSQPADTVFDVLAGGDIEVVEMILGHTGAPKSTLGPILVRDRTKTRDETSTMLLKAREACPL